MSNGLINRQYVGARYVPKIMGEWNKALQYEALSVVTYMGNSFTSKVPVPANSIDINNTDYWVNTGNYNAQVENYRNEVKALDNKVDNIKNRYFLFIGDSYAEGKYSWNPSVIGWSDYMQGELGINDNFIFKSVKGGSGYVSSPVGTNITFQYLLENAPVEDKSLITDIVVCGGYNDGNKSNLSEGINAFCNKAKELYPNATIWGAYIGWTSNTSEWNNLANGRRTTEATLSNNGCNIMYNVDLIMHNYIIGEVYDSYNVENGEGFHPNSKANKEIANAIANILKYSNYNYSHPANIITIDRGENVYIAYGQQNIYSEKSNGYGEIGTLNSITVKPLPEKTFDIVANGETKYLFAKLNNSLYFGNNSNTSQCNATCFIRDASNTITECTCVISIVQNNLYLSVNALDDTKQNWKTFTGVTDVIIPHFKITACSKNC